MSKPEFKKAQQLLSQQHSLEPLADNTFERYKDQIKSFFNRNKEDFQEKEISSCFILHDKENQKMELLYSGKIYCYLRLVEKRFFSDRVKYVLVNPKESHDLANVRIEPQSITHEFTRVEGIAKGKERSNQFDRIIISSEPFVDKMKGVRGYRNGIVDGIATISKIGDENVMTYQNVAKTQTKRLSKQQVRDIAGKDIDQEAFQTVLNNVFYKTEECPIEFVAPDLNDLKRDVICYSFFINRGTERLEQEEISSLFKQTLVKADSLEKIDGLQVKPKEKVKDDLIPNEFDGLQVDKRGNRLHYKKTAGLPSDEKQPRKGSLGKPNGSALGNNQEASQTILV